MIQKKVLDDQRCKCLSKLEPSSLHSSLITTDNPYDANSIPIRAVICSENRLNPMIYVWSLNICQVFKFLSSAQKCCLVYMGVKRQIYRNIGMEKWTISETYCFGVEK